MNNSFQMRVFPGRVRGAGAQRRVFEGRCWCLATGLHVVHLFPYSGLCSRQPGSLTGRTSTVTCRLGCQGKPPTGSGHSGGGTGAIHGVLLVYSIQITDGTAPGKHKDRHASALSHWLGRSAALSVARHVVPDTVVASCVPLPTIENTQNQ